MTRGKFRNMFGQTLTDYFAELSKLRPTIGFGDARAYWGDDISVETAVQMEEDYDDYDAERDSAADRAADRAEERFTRNAFDH